MNIKKINKLVLILALTYSFLIGQRIDGTKSNPSKPFACAIFIDHEEEIDIFDSCAITLSLSSLFYTQSCPIIIFGKHLLTNLTSFFGCIDYENKTMVKFGVLINDKIEKFEKNWLLIQISEDINDTYLLIPKKYLEYFFDLKINTQTSSLSEQLETMLSQGKIYDSSGKKCTNLGNLIYACGFNFYNGSKYTLFDKYKLFSIEPPKSPLEYQVFYDHVQNCLSQIFRLASQNNKWNIYMNGHGESIAHGDFNAFVGLPENIFVPTFKEICNKNINFVYLSSCHLGGKNRIIIKILAKELNKKNKCPKIILESPTDSPSYSFYLNEIYSENDFHNISKLTEFYFKDIDSITCCGIYPTSYIPQSFFTKTFSLKEIAFSASMSSVNDTINLVPSNWPLILEPSKEFKFKPINHPEYICIENETKNCLTNGQHILFLKSVNLYNIDLYNKIPVIISLNPGEMVHIINQINANSFDITIEMFLQEAFINPYLQNSISREFIIKQLKLKNTNYSKIYVNQFYDHEIKAEIVDMIWQQNNPRNHYFVEYQNIPNGNASFEWEKTQEKKLTPQQIKQYNNQFEKAIKKKYVC